jgi:hypothetical protein
MPLKQIDESPLESWLRKHRGPVVPRNRQLPSKHQKDQNPKWNDDAWFEKQYGDPHYYDRVKGLD